MHSETRDKGLAQVKRVKKRDKEEEEDHRFILLLLPCMFPSPASLLPSFLSPPVLSKAEAASPRQLWGNFGPETSSLLTVFGCTSSRRGNVLTYKDKKRLNYELAHQVSSSATCAAGKSNSRVEGGWRLCVVWV
ncbi:hypothetical protein E2C01_099441 [Portunus trituberculatus]|uniref:Uncharacterized protein n=1 Tax=Portunus trituberculatus TaxID=210409 RepID=A0A5B7KAZ5_PORTR|nr:hypothetical protein [Portunus trituberculatus]